MFENRYAWFLYLLDSSEIMAQDAAELQSCRSWFNELIKENALVHCGNASSLFCPQCDDLHGLEVDPITFKGYCVDTGFVCFKPEDLMEYQASPQWMIAAIRKSFGVAVADKNQEGVNDTCWRIGSVRLDKKLRPLFFCRNYAERMTEINQNVAALSGEPGVVLLTSPHKRNPEKIAEHLAVSIATCMKDHSAKFSLCPEILGRLWSNRPAEKGRLTHAPDFRTVTLDGRTHHFPGELQRKFVKRLIELHNEGVTSAKTSDIMSAIGGENTRRIGDLFKGHKTWEQLIEYGGRKDLSSHLRRGTCRLMID